MRPDTPILMITLQIPVVPELSVDDILDAIGQQVGEALANIREKKAEVAGSEEPAIEAAVAGGTSISTEIMEPFTEEMREDILARLGYSPLG